MARSEPPPDINAQRRPAGVLLFHSQQGVIESDQAWASAGGLSHQQTLGDGWLTALAPCSRVPATAQLREAAKGHASVGVEWQLAGRTAVRRVDAVAQPLPLARRTHTCIVAMVDVTNTAAHQDELVYAATHDSLSGLLNRAAFDAAVGHALSGADRRETTVAVLFIDLDGFKSVNDSFGHGVGDAVLVSASDRLTAILRPNDTVARLGGDEFVILCEDVHRMDDALIVARRVVETMAQPFVVDGAPIQVAASVGVALAGEAATTSALVQRADHAMYDAKQRGPGSIAVCGAAPGSRATAARPSRPGDPETLQLPVSTRVEVRERYRGGWCGGYRVASASPRGYRLRRTSDGHVLPVEFDARSVRRTP
jgi:diguanylate cyclase (GGDEF)-like protein